MTETLEWETDKANHIYDFQAKSVKIWEDKAISLKVASDIIYTNLVENHGYMEQEVNNSTGNEYSYYHIVFGLDSLWMLSVGYAVECLIKAIIILTASVDIIIPDNGNMKLNTGQLFGGKTHDLDKLLKHVLQKYRPKFDDGERLFLCKMSTYTIWRGKYPIPLDATLLKPIYSRKDIEQALIEKIVKREVKYAEYVETKGDKDKKAFDGMFDKFYDKLSEAKNDLGK